MELPDRELMGRLSRGDREALGGLMERHYRRLYRIALCYLRNGDDALDCVQETFVKAFQNAARWDPASEPGPWLTRIAINDAIDRYRRAKRRAASDEPLEGSDHDPRLAADGASPERVALSGELGVRIGRALATLPERQRAVFVLRHYQEKTLPEIADVLGMRLGTVKSSLHRAVHRLRERLAGLRP
jgi:RNA polymerase sigma-70 factor (ECF subfamily)